MKRHRGKNRPALQPGQVWRNERLKKYRRILTIDDQTVAYSVTPGADHVRLCDVLTFRRWVRTWGAKLTQRQRRRELVLTCSNDAA